MTHRDETIRSAPARSCIDVAGGHDGGTPQPRFGDRYRNARFIGAGGMGQVFRVYDAVLERDVALKSLSETATPKAHARFSREATTTAGLGHPGIVTVYDKGSFDGAPYYTMELLTGGRWDPADGTALRTQLERLAHVCAAVGFANERAVVHRDLKPANVLMSEHGDLVVVDWGLARVGAQPEGPETTVPSDASVTRQGDLLGTPLYMSPEQARGEPTDARADVWALGMMLLELLSKEHPFAGLRSAEIVERLAANDVPSARSYLPTTAPELLAVVERATSTHRSERYASSTALSEDLRRYLDGRRVRAFTYSKRDALRRVYKAFGPLINVSVAATLGTVAIAGWAWSRTASERDRALLAEQTALALEQRARSAERDAVAEKATADAVSKRLLAEQARAALDSGDVARAESRAVASLALGASPDARGVVMQTTAMPRAELLHSYPLPCSTPTLSSAGQSILCKDEDSVSVFDATDGREVLDIVDLPTDGVVLLDDSTAMLTWGNGPRAAAYELGNVYSLESAVPSVSASTLRQPSEPVEGYHEMLERIVATATCRAGLPKLAVEVGRRVVVVCPTGEVQLDGRAVPTGTIPINGIKALGDGAVAFSRDDGELSILDVRTGRFESWSTQAKRIDAIGVAAEHLVTLATERGYTLLWDTNRRAASVQLPKVWGRAHRLRNDGTFVSLGDRVRIWRFSNHTDAARFDAGHGISEAHLAEGSNLLAGAAADGSVVLWDTTSGGTRWRGVWDPRLVVIKATSIVSKGEYVVGLDALDGHIQVFRSADGSLANVLENGWGGRRLVALRDDSIWATSYEGGLRRWEHPLSKDAPHRLAFGGVSDASPSEHRTAAVLLEEGTADVVRIRANSLDIERLGRSHDAIAVDITDEGNRIAIAFDRSIQVVDDQLHPWAPGVTTDSDIIDVSISGSGDLIAAGLRDGRVQVWTTESGVLEARLAPHELRVAHVDFVGNTLTSASWDGTVRRYDLGALGRTEPSEPR